MGLYKHLRLTWKKPSEEFFALQRQRMIEWRKEPVTLRIERPTRLDRARALGYKAKPGVIVVRQRLNRGGRHRPDIKGGRRSKHSGQVKVLGKNYQQVAEERAGRKYPNAEVINSYFVGKDGHHYWYEVVLADRSHPAILADKNLSWVSEKQHRSRAARGLTSAGRKGRGLRHKGRGAEKLRPSRSANERRRS